MDWPELMVYFNLAIGTAGATVYALWSGKWLHRKAWLAFIFNLLSSLACLGFVLGYAFMALVPDSHDIVQGIFRYLVAILMGAPTLARIVEYRRDQRREDFAQDVIKSMRTESAKPGVRR